MMCTLEVLHDPFHRFLMCVYRILHELTYNSYCSHNVKPSCNHGINDRSNSCFMWYLSHFNSLFL